MFRSGRSRHGGRCLAAGSMAVFLLMITSGGGTAEPPSPQLARLDVTDIEGRAAGVTAMAVDPNRGLICVGTDDHRLQIIDARTMTLITSERAHRDRIRSVCFSPDGDRLASVGNDGRLQVWRLPSTDGVEVPLSPGSIRLRRSQVMDRTPALARVQFTPNGDGIVAVGFTKTIYVLGQGTGGSRRIACSHMDLRAVTHDARQRLVVAGRGGAVHVFDDESLASVRDDGRRGGTTSHLTEFCQCQTNPGSINDIALLPSDGRIVCVCDEGMVSQYDAEGNQVADRVRIGRGRLFAVVAIDSHRVAVAGSDDTIRVVDLSTGRVTHSLRGHHGSVVDLALLDGRLISAGYDATIRVWRIDDTTMDKTRIAEKASFRQVE